MGLKIKGRFAKLNTRLKAPPAMAQGPSGAPILKSINPPLPTSETTWDLSVDGDLILDSAETYTFTVDEDVILDFAVYGAGGGGSNYPYAGGNGGGGGKAEGQVLLQGGQTYTMVVGGRGREGGNVPSGGSQGFGGNGGGANQYGNAGGGDLSGILIGTGTPSTYISSQALLIAGGGGGAGSTNVDGGAGGGTSGNDGTPHPNHPATSAKGGTQTAGGAGGVGSSASGSPGTLFLGGQGGLPSGTYTGPGGGGGYYGGGGGGHISSDAIGSAGGGSGYLHPTYVTNGTLTAGNNNGNPLDSQSAGTGGNNASDNATDGKIIISYTTSNGGGGDTDGTTPTTPTTTSPLSLSLTGTWPTTSSSTYTTTAAGWNTGGDISTETLPDTATFLVTITGGAGFGGQLPYGLLGGIRHPDGSYATDEDVEAGAAWYLNVGNAKLAGVPNVTYYMFHYDRYGQTLTLWASNSLPSANDTPSLVVPIASADPAQVYFYLYQTAIEVQFYDGFYDWASGSSLNEVTFVTDANLTSSGANEFSYTRSGSTPSSNSKSNGLLGDNRYYFEVDVVNTAGDQFQYQAIMFGLAQADYTGGYDGPGATYIYPATSPSRIYPSGANYPNCNFTTGDTIMVAYDGDTREVWFGVNGVWGEDPTSASSYTIGGASGDQVAIVFGSGTAGSITMTGTVITGNNLTYSVPSGFTSY